MALRDLILASALFVSAAGMAGAQDAHDFDDLDMDGDGVLTLAELTAGFDDGAGDDPEEDAAEVLALQDVDRDGVVSRAEAGADGLIYEPERREDRE